MNVKKVILTSIIGLSCLALSGCSFINDFINGDVSDDTFDVDKIDVNGKTIIQQTYKDYSDNNIYPIDYCPTIGNINLLIIPIWFTNSDSYIKAENKETVREDIRKAYLGSNEETGWRSVKTYYEELSNYSLSISGTVTDWYQTTYSSIQAGINDSVTNDLVVKASDWYFDNNPSDKRENYDSDNNCYIDAVMLIYGAPDHTALNDNSLSNLWAYCYWLQEENTSNKPIANAFFWASYDFMYSDGTRFSPTPAGTAYGTGDTSHCEIDAHTYIHEMGHVFGLDDYYDYSSHSYSPAGGFSMQDLNVGSHDPYSVMALGWANPYVITDCAEVTIGTFQKTRDLVVLTENWNGIGSPFDEYLILELYSPTGLNEFDCLYYYADSIRGPFTTGIRMWHVDSRLAYVDSIRTVIDEYGDEVNVPVFSPRKMTTNAKDNKATYGVFHAFSNSYDDEDYGSVLGEKYYDYNLLELIKKSRKNNWNYLTYDFDEGDLFTTGKYQMSTFSRFFVNSSPFKMNNGTFADWKIRITIDGIGHDANAKIEIVK